MTWVAALVGQLWANVWVLIPLALVAAAIPRLVPCRPVTRHVLWVVVLSWCVASALMPPAPSGDWLARVTARNVIHADPEPVPAGAQPAVATYLGHTSPEASDCAYAVPAASPESAAEAADRLATQQPVSPGDCPAENAGPPRYTRNPAMSLRPQPADSGDEAVKIASPTLAPASPKPRFPTPPRAAEPSPAPVAEAWRAWAGLAVALRDTLRGLPPIPARIWLGGIVLMLGLGLLRTLWFARCLRPAWPTPAWVQREVESIARRLQLRRVPRVDMVATRVSPMIWCGAHPRLVIPTALWAQLDRNGRRAILCHELAHLRRRDHWVRWLQWVVGALYWWHPIVWWVRKRIDDEADLCCDAWVTWLLPQGRRAYAEALLKTRHYISTQHAAVPATGMAVATSGARRLARRLTMVMTQTVRPRTSLTGVVLAGGLVLAAWMVTPALSCPPSADAAELAALERSVAAQPTALVREDPDQPPPPRPPKAPRAPRAARAPEADGAPVEPGVPIPPDAPAPPPRLRTRVEGRGGGGAAGAPLPMLPPMYGGGEEARTYAVPEGQREALTELMIRDDVPVRVRPTEEGLEVHGTPAQHDAFDAFLRALQKQTEVTRTYELPAGKLDAFYALMERQDVPISVSRAENGITVRATPLQQLVVARFVELIHPKAQTRGALGMGGWTPSAVPTPPGAWGLAAPEAPGANAARAQQRALEEYARAVRAYGQGPGAGSGRSVDELRRQAAELEAQAESIEAQAQAFEKQYEQLEQDAQDLTGREAAELERQLRALQREIEKLNRAAERLSQRAEAIQSRADGQEAAVDALREAELAAAEAQREAAAAEREAWREAEAALQEAQREAQEATREALREAAEAERESQRAAEEAAREAERDAEQGRGGTPGVWLPAAPAPVACVPPAPSCATPLPALIPPTAQPGLPALAPAPVIAPLPAPALLSPGALVVPPSVPGAGIHQLLERGVRALSGYPVAPAPLPVPPPVTPPPAL